MNHKRSSIFYLILGFTLLFGMACTALSTLIATPTPLPTNTPIPTVTASSTPTPTATPIPDYDGAWQGTSSQEKALSFVIENNTLSSLEVEVDMEGSGCTTNAKGSLKFDEPIVEGAFQAEVKIGDGTYAFVGHFDTEASASGILRYSQTGQCAGNVEVQWSATKDGSE